MKIALLSPIAWRTPPRQYGPWEQVVSSLAEGLVANGIDTTLFATGDAVTSAKLDYSIGQPYEETPGVDVKVSECLHISHLMERAGDFDLIHNNYDFLPLSYSRLISTPILTTIHGFSSPLIVPVYEKYNNSSFYVSISNADRNAALQYIATVYNGIQTEKFSFNNQPEDYLLFFGRIHPHKGAKEAIAVAKACRKKIILAGFIQDVQYYDSCVKPFINDDDVVYAGNCGPEERNRLLGNAAALLHLISFDEPFGLSVAEAMCCGTPVIAFNRGAMPELIEDKKTGFLVRSEEEAIDAVKNIDSLTRKDCHDRAVRLFSAERMATDYIAVYKKILAIK